MSKIGAMFSATAASVVALTMASGAVAAETTLTAVTSLVQANPLSKSFLQTFVPMVNKECKGQVQVKYLGGPEVVPPGNAYKAVERGQYDVLHGPVSYFAGAFPESYGMLASNQSVAQMKANGGWAMLDGLFQKKVGAKLVGWGESEVQYRLYLINNPKLDKDGLPDFHGLKMRSTATYRPLFEALGASTVNMKESEIYGGLERGVVGGFGWPVVGVPELGLHKLIKYRVDPRFYRGITTVTMNLKKWKSLSKAQQDCVDKVANEYTTAGMAFMKKEEAYDDKQLDDAGVKMITLKGEARKKFLHIAYDGVWNEFLKRAPEAKALRDKLYKPE